MKRCIKKMVTIGLAMAMVAGMAVTGSAAQTGIACDSDTISLSGGSADCYIECDNDYAYASTSVYTDFDVESISAYAEVSFDILVDGRRYEYVGTSDDSDDPSYGRSASASCEVSTDASYSLAGSAGSYHVAEIDGDSDSCSLSVEN